MKTFRTGLVISALVVALSAQVAGAASTQSMLGINVVLKGDITPTILSDLSKYGTVQSTYPAIDALTMKVRTGVLSTVRALPYVAAANEDQKRVGKPVAENPVADTSNGTATWDLDQIDVADVSSDNRNVASGEGVYVAVLDTGLLTTWPAYFNSERIATNYARAFGGGGGERGTVSSQPNKWQTDQDSHGTHVTSTIIGYRYSSSIQIQGVAPLAKIIPVKVLGQNGSGWSSVVAAGIMYIADLKSGVLSGSPVVINMSLGGPSLDAMEQAAIDYAISAGVIVVASAGNSGTAGMGFPGGYPPVISVGASGFTGEWTGASNAIRSWWRLVDVPETGVATAYITDFSSRQVGPNQQLDVVAPGSWVVGPYQTNGQLSYYFLGGTSMASPHVAGVVALMAQCRNGLTAASAESVLKSTAWPMSAGSQTVALPNGTTTSISWGTDAVGSGLVNAPAAIASACP